MSSTLLHSALRLLLVIAGISLATGTSLTAAGSQAALPRVLVLVDDTAAANFPDPDWWLKASNGIQQGQADFSLDAYLYLDTQASKLLAPDFALNQYSAVIFSSNNPTAYKDFFRRVNNHRIPIIGFHATDQQQANKFNTMLQIYSSNYTLGVRVGERAAFLGKFTYSCLYSAKNPGFASICKGFHFGRNQQLHGERSLMLPPQTDKAKQMVKNELELNHARLFVTLDAFSAHIVAKLLEQESAKQTNLYHISMARHPQIFDWLEQERMVFAFYHHPWLEGYLAMAAAAVAMEKLQHDPIDIIVGIRSNQLLNQRLDEYALVIYYENAALHSTPGIVDTGNLDKVRPVWGSIW